MINDTAIIEAYFFFIIFERTLYLLFDQVLSYSLIIDFDVLFAVGRFDLKDNVSLVKLSYFLIIRNIKDFI